jgi:hypothetical protein
VDLPATHFSRKSAEEILADNISVFARIFLNLMFERQPCSGEPFARLNTVTSSLGI